MTYLFVGTTFEQVPAFLQGSTVIRTRRGDRKEKSNDSFLNFIVNQPLTVFVGHDQELTSKPSWLNAFNPDGESLTLGEGSTLDLYKKGFAQGTVTLGANHGKSGTIMYTVIIVGQ